MGWHESTASLALTNTLTCKRKTVAPLNILPSYEIGDLANIKASSW